MSDIPDGAGEAKKKITHDDILKTLTYILDSCTNPATGRANAYTGMTISDDQARHLYRARQMVDEHAILHAGRRSK